LDKNRRVQRYGNQAGIFATSAQPNPIVTLLSHSAPLIFRAAT
jgi:hypothetical protein